VVQNLQKKKKKSNKKFDASQSCPSSRYLTQFAAAKAGLILVNINPAYQPDELKYCLNKVSRERCTTDVH
jgi:acyl-CoA synthetase (AMP-forming)/AMP-acid ligase II